MGDEEVENFIGLDVPHVTESDKIKLRLKNFCYVIGFLFILWFISIIIIVVNNKGDPVQDESISKDENYIKAEKFISNLSFIEIRGLLNATNNIKSIIENNQENLCEGQINSFNNSKVNFKGMCLQEGTTGVRFPKGKGILWQSEINTASTFNKALMFKIGEAQGKESKKKGINTLLSPCANIMRRPQDGILW